MSNFTNFVNTIGTGTSFNGTSSPVGGVVGTFGTPEILGIAGIVIILVIGIVKKASPDLIMISTMTMLTVIASAFGTTFEWIQWLFVIGGGGIFGLGLIKIIKHR